MPRNPRSGGQAMRVLVTEDDEVLATALAAGLRREGWPSTWPSTVTPSWSSNWPPT